MDHPASVPLTNSNNENSNPTASPAWIEKAQQGDVVSFKELYKLHIDSVYSLSYHVMEDVEYAEDLTKRIFIRAWETLAKFEPDSNGSQWLAAVAHPIIWERVRTKNVPHTFIKDPTKNEIEKISMDTFSDKDPTKKQVQPARPSRSFWAEIQGYIETENIAPNDRGKEKRSFSFLRLAIGALALLIGGFGVVVITITLLSMEPAEVPAQNLTTPPATDNTPVETVPLVAQQGIAPAPAANTSLTVDEKFSKLQKEYNQLKTEVLGSVEIDEGDHDTDIQGAMENDLGLVEKTISEIVGAMGDDPENAMLEKMLVATYQKQINLLQKFIRLGD